LEEATKGLQNIEKSESKSTKSVDRGLARKKSASNIKPPQRISSLSRAETVQETPLDKPTDNRERDWAKFRKQTTQKETT